MELFSLGPCSAAAFKKAGRACPLDSGEGLGSAIQASQAPGTDQQDAESMPVHQPQLLMSGSCSGTWHEAGNCIGSGHTDET